MLNGERLGAPWTDDRDAELRRLREARWAWCRIAAALGVSEDETRSHAAGLGLDTGRLPWASERPNGRYRRPAKRDYRA